MSKAEGWCMAKVLDGTAIAAAIKAEVKAEVDRLVPKGIRPGLAAVLVGHVPASEIYVRSKVKTCESLGLFSELITPPETVTTDEMLSLITHLNAREDIDGILIQLPLPSHVNAKLLLEAVSPDKDVDGFHPMNVGRLQTGQTGLARSRGKMQWLWGAATSSENPQRSCCWRRMRRSPCAIPRRTTWGRLPGKQISWWSRLVSRP
jgi:hypothetical protein